MKIHKNMDYTVFLQTYYLKEELIQFCAQEGLQVSGSKQDLTNCIAHYLRYDEKKKIRKKAKVHVQASMDSVIVDNMAFDENLRDFFREHLGKKFHFSVPFQRWLKNNVGKTLSDAIAVYPQLEKNIIIDPQFKYNTYFRDFFADNPNATRKEAIACWNYKKQQLGNHKYEKSDLKNAR